MYQLVKKSYKFLHKKKYLEAMALIESVKVIYPHNSYILFLYAVIAVFNDKFDKAYRVLDQLGKDSPDYEPLICLQAFLTMKSVKSQEDASAVYGEYITKYPQVKELYKGLNSVTAAKDFSLFQKNVSLTDVVNIPHPPSSLKKLNQKNKNDKSKESIDQKIIRQKRSYKSESSGSVSKSTEAVKKTLIVLLILIVISILSLAAFYFFKETYKNLNNNKTVIEDDRIDQVTLGGSAYDLIQRINRKPVPVFYYSPIVLSKDFNKAKILIKRNKLNDSLLLLNKIYNSNANQLVKEKVDFLIKFVVAQETRIYQKVNFKKFTKKLYLYRGFGILLSGRVSNLKKSRKGTSFTLLVNYDKDDNFSGVINIYNQLDLEKIENGKRVNVKGVFVTTVGKKKNLHIVAHSVKML